MTMDTTKVTSKTSTLKALLLRAWRERWSDLQWGIQIKTVLPRGVSGDVYNLADCILQQALIGPGPNHLVLSYLKHSLSSQLVSYAAVLQRISKYKRFNKPHCIISLLELLESIQKRITCRGKPEDGLLLATALLSIVHWLLSCIHHAMEKLADLKISPEHTVILEKPIAILQEMIACDFTQSMIYLAKQEDKTLDNELQVKCKEVENMLTEGASGGRKDDIKQILNDFLHLDPSVPKSTTDYDCPEPLAYSLQAFLSFEALLNPCNDIQVIVNQLIVFKQIKGYSAPRLYCEVLRACLISMCDALNLNDPEFQWSAFTFLKIPHVLSQLHWTLSGKTLDSSEIPEPSADIVEAFDLLLQYGPLLEMTDVKCRRSSVDCLLSELHKTGLVTEKQVKHITSLRESVSGAVGPAKLEQSSSQPNLLILLRAEPTVASVLKTLDADFTKNQDALLGVLCHVLTGKSFEVILVVSAATGKLGTFAAKLIKCMECIKQLNGDAAKTTQTRAMFDILFLMLCYIVQTYGTQVVLSEEGVAGSFFEQWVTDAMPEGGRSNSPDLMLQHCEPTEVSHLLAVFNCGDGDMMSSIISFSMLKWHEICLHIPAVIKEVLLAWEHGAVSATDVKRILDAMRSRMCCLPVCAAVWLNSYMQTLHQDALLKPMNMIQQFLTPNPAEELAQQENFKERSTLMFPIIKKLLFGIHPTSHSKGKVTSFLHSMVSNQPITELLQKTWAAVHHRGRVDSEDTKTLQSLLNTGGPEWFVATIVKDALTPLYREELDRATDLAFSVFHLDIEDCTLTLLLQTLPKYLHSESVEDLMEPKSTALAQLCVYCIYAALQAQKSSKANPVSLLRRKRSRDLDMQNLCDTLLGSRTAKVRRLAPQLVGGEDGSLGIATPSSNVTNAATDSPIHRALTSLFASLALIVQRPQISQQTQFVVRFLEAAVLAGRDQVQSLLHHMPLNLIPFLLCSLSDQFSMGLVLRLYDALSTTARKACARDLCLLRNIRLKPGSIPDFKL